MLKKTALFLIYVISSCAFAQAEKFAGFSIGFNTGIESNELRFNETSTSLGAHSTPYNINGSYTFALSPFITFATGLTYDISDAKAIDYYRATSQIKNHYSINLEPGYALNNTTLGYLKIAYHSASSSITSAPATYSHNISGWGYGFGSKLNLFNNLFLNLEVQQVNYLNYQPNTAFTSGEIKHTSTLGTVGLSYSF